MLRLIFRLGVVVAVGAVVLIVAAFGVGALLNVPTLHFMAEGGFTLHDPLRGINLWRDLDIDRFDHVAFNAAQSHMVVASTFGGQSAEVRIYNLPEGQLLCAQTVENTSYLTFAYSRAGNWFNDHSLLLYNNLVVFHLDVPTCTLTEIARFDNRIQSLDIADPYAVIRIAKPGNRHELYLYNVAQGEQRLIAAVQSEIPNVTWYWSSLNEDENGHPRYLLYSSSEGFHVHDTLTGNTQNVSNAFEGYANWIRPDVILVHPNFQMRVAPIAMYSFVDGRVGERLFYEESIYLSDNYSFGTWTQEWDQYFYVADDVMTEDFSTGLYRYDFATRTSTHLLPEYTDIDYVFFLTQDGPLLINRRDDALPTLALDLATGRVRELEVRLDTSRLGGLNEYELIYPGPDNTVMAWNNRDLTQRPLMTLNQGERVNWAWGEAGYLALVVNVSAGVDCLRVVTWYATRDLFCAPSNSISFWWGD